jgi:acetyltransferase-like isoleucine patch superfamily enzyme
MARLTPVVYILLALVVPNFGRRYLARWLLGARVDDSATVGVSLIDARNVELGPGSSIGHFSVIRNLDVLSLGKNARIGTFNWIFGARATQHFATRPMRKSALVLDEGASITSRHLMDCTDQITIGAFATVAGFRSQVLTHSINVVQNEQDCEPVTIGAYSFIGTGAILLKGSQFPAKSVLAAGSVYHGAEGDEYWIYSGVPAKPVKRLPDNAEYMRRNAPRVM